MTAKIGSNVIFRGRVDLPADAQVQDNVVLGSSDNGTVTIGTNALIRSGSVVYSGVKIGSNLRTGHHVVIRENTVIGNNVLLGTHTVVDGNCRIGDNVSAQTNVYITAHAVIEDDVFLGPCSTTTNDKYMQYGAQLKGPIIMKGARIGANATILPGVTVKSNAIVGAGAVVTKDVEEGDTVVGNPAHSLKSQPRSDSSHVQCHVISKEAFRA